MKEQKPKKGTGNADPKQFKSKRSRRPARSQQADEFDQKIIDIARVTRVTAGGKRMKFRACVVIGDKKNRLGIGIAKGADVTIAINKAVLQAKKKIVTIPIVKGTIPHEIYVKFGAAKIFMKPGRSGNRIKAGGVVKMVLGVTGIEDICTKILGSNNRINNAQATVKGLQSFIVKADPVKPKIVNKNGSKEIAKGNVKKFNKPQKGDTGFVNKNKDNKKTE